jgi:hypothetical protein
MDPTHQFISDAALRLMGISDRTLVDYIQAIGTLSFRSLGSATVTGEAVPAEASIS